jgi:hypothetical protein
MISPSINNAGPFILPCNGEKTLPVLLTISNYAEKILLKFSLIPYDRNEGEERWHKFNTRKRNHYYQNGSLED